MKVLGITTEGDSGAAVVEDGRILAAVNEERLCRMKLVAGFPRDSIGAVMKLSGTEVRELDAVLVAGEYSELVNQLEPFDGWFQTPSKGFRGFLKTYGASSFSRFRNVLPGLESAYYRLQLPAAYYRQRELRRILREEFAVQCPIVFVDHHLAHITSAYFTSGFDNALIISLDGGGDRKSSLVYHARDGRLVKLHEVSAFNSLGNYYAYVTHLCGFKAMKHEGKITGLAAYGEPKYVPLLKNFIDEHNGSFFNRGGVVHRAALRKLESRLPHGWLREDLACSIQQLCEILTKRFVRHWQQQTGATHLALAGGVFANVRINQELQELDGIERIFIHPHMGDGGLAVGGALAACLPGVLQQTMRRSREPLRDVYLGPDLSERSIDDALRGNQLQPQPLASSLENEVAELLTQGFVVARADGQMEYGPRALGNRSILYQPTDRSVNEWLNERLRRTEFMPFAPAVLYEECDKCFDNAEAGKHAAEFMTITYGCTPWTRRHMAGVVHLDHTARPQLVRQDCNRSLYEIINAFYSRTGLPAVINTSFNMHEEPIVCTADDCVRAFLQGNLDYLAIGPHLIKHPRGITHPLKSVSEHLQRVQV